MLCIQPNFRPGGNTGFSRCSPPNLQTHFKQVRFVAGSPSYCRRILLDKVFFSKLSTGSICSLQTRSEPIQQILRTGSGLAKKCQLLKKHRKTYLRLCWNDNYWAQIPPFSHTFNHSFITPDKNNNTYIVYNIVIRNIVIRILHPIFQQESFHCAWYPNKNGSQIIFLCLTFNWLSLNISALLIHYLLSVVYSRSYYNKSLFHHSYQ